MSEQRLRNLYLPPFKAAIDAGADTVMCSFNSLNGVPGCANHHTETGILKKEWHFRRLCRERLHRGRRDREVCLPDSPRCPAVTALQPTGLTPGPTP